MNVFKPYIFKASGYLCTARVGDQCSACLEGAGNHKELMLKGPYGVICGSQMLLPSASPGGFIKTQMARPYPRVSDFTVVGWGPRICISYKFPGNAGATGLGTTLRELLI